MDGEDPASFFLLSKVRITEMDYTETVSNDDTCTFASFFKLDNLASERVTSTKKGSVLL